jgi:ribosomal protein S18 acetylase RimI-like enzyme
MKSKGGFNVKIQQWGPHEAIPIDLLLLADPSENLVRQYVSRGKLFVGEEGDETIGVFILIDTKPGTTELVNVAVEEHQQGKGFGKMLVKHAIQIAQKGGYKTIEVGTGNSSLNQLALYQKCGFRMTGVDRDYFLRNYEEEIVENGLLCRDLIRLSLDL